MKKTLLACFIGLLALTAIAWLLMPHYEDDGRTALTWTTDANPQREDQVAIFNQLHPDLSLRVDPDNRDVMKVVVQSSAGMGPDLIDHITNHNFATYLDAGILWDITEEAEALGFGPETLHPAVRPLVMIRDVETLEHRQYFYPSNVAHNFIIYNKDHFDEAGLPYPATDLLWDEYMELAQKLTRYPPDGGEIPERFGNAGISPLLMIWGKGGDLINADGTRALMDTPETVAGIKLWHDLFFKYRIEPTPSQRAGVISQGGWGGGGSYYSWFGEGKLSMFSGSRWMLIQLRRQFHDQLEMKRRWKEANPEVEYSGPLPPRMGAVLMPRFAGANRYTGFGARCTGINKMSPNRDKALHFLRYLAGPEYSETINFGADSKPGNVEFSRLELFRHPDWPEEDDIHRISIESFDYGRIVPISLFIPASTINRFFNQAFQQIRSDPGLDEESIARIMQRAAARVDLEIKRNIERQPQLRQAYHRLLQEGAEPIALQLDKEAPK